MSVVERLKTSREITHNIRHNGLVRELPSRASLQLILDALCAALFPTHFGQALFAEMTVDDYVAERLASALHLLHDQIQRSLQFDLAEPRDDAALKHKAKLILDEFADQLPVIRGLLVSDFRAAFRNDPAAESIAEVVLCYRGTIAITYHRFAQQLMPAGRGSSRGSSPTSRRNRPPSTSTPARASGRASSSTTAPASSSARRR